MRETDKRLPVTMDAGPAHMRSADWGGMTSAYMRMGEDAEYVEFSPRQEMDEVLTHIEQKMQAG